MRVCVLTRGFIFLAILAGCLWPAVSPGARPDPPAPLAATVDPRELPLGGRVVLTLAYRLPEGATLPLAPAIGGLDDLTLVERRLEPGRIRLTFLVDRLGTWATGPLSLTYLDRAGQPVTVTAEGVTVTVRSNLGERPAEATLRPLQTILPTRGLLAGRLGVWLGGGAGLAILAGLGVWWHLARRRRRRPAWTEPPHIQARRALSELESARLWERGQVKAYYFRLSSILRRYLEQLRGFPAGELTTPEIAAHLNPDEDRRLLMFLRHSDLVKFADLKPSPEARGEDARMVSAYIEATAPRPAEPAPAAGREGRAI